MRISVTGAKGMLGRTLVKRLSSYGEVQEIDIDNCDITNQQAIIDVIAGFSPDVVIHCAAVTKVDDCETKLALPSLRVNSIGSANVAEACRRAGARLIAISTDYVFDGRKTYESYDEYDLPNPQTMYGMSKYLGERLIRAILPSSVIVRVAWLYGAGGPSFIHTLDKLGSAESTMPVKVVDDQFGNPTSADSVADVLVKIIFDKTIVGIVHGTCSGTCTWYELARELYHLRGHRRELIPCTTTEFPRPAKRPANSSLLHRCFNTTNWKIALQQFIAKYPNL